MAMFMNYENIIAPYIEVSLLAERKRDSMVINGGTFYLEMCGLSS